MQYKTTSICNVPHSPVDYWRVVFYVPEQRDNRYSGKVKNKAEGGG